MIAATIPSERRSRKRMRTRSALLAAGQQLCAKRALEGISIDEIVAVADVSKGSFYNHFVDKTALADAIVALIHGDLEFNIAAANRNVASPAQRMVRALGVVLSYGLTHPERVQALLSLSQRRTTADSQLNSGLAHDLKTGLEQGCFKGIDVETGVLLVTGTFVILLRHVTESGSTTPLDVLGIKMGAAILRGLGVDAADADQIAGHIIETLVEQVRP